MDELRERCPWDRVQTHTSLGRYLLEESYEALDALEALAAALDDEAEHGATPDSATLVRAAAHHAEEELGDVLFQLVFHARLGIEEGCSTCAASPTPCDTRSSRAIPTSSPTRSPRPPTSSQLAGRS